MKGGYTLFVELHSPTAKHYTFYFLFFQLLILTIQIFFTEHISFRVMCRERAWLFKSGIVFVQRKSATFNVRHGLCTEKGHGLLTQAVLFTSLSLPLLPLYSLFGFPLL